MVGLTIGALVALAVPPAAATSDPASCAAFAVRVGGTEAGGVARDPCTEAASFAPWAVVVVGPVLVRADAPGGETMRDGTVVSAHATSGSARIGIDGHVIEIRDADARASAGCRNGMALPGGSARVRELVVDGRVVTVADDREIAGVGTLRFARVELGVDPGSKRLTVVARATWLETDAMVDVVLAEARVSITCSSA